MFGLAQLYQLRVASVALRCLRAYAYFTTPRDRSVTEWAEKRLKVPANPSIASAPASTREATISTCAFRATSLGDQKVRPGQGSGRGLYKSMLEDAVQGASVGRTRRR